MKRLRLTLIVLAAGLSVSAWQVVTLTVLDERPGAPAELPRGAEVAGALEGLAPGAYRWPGVAPRTEQERFTQEERAAYRRRHAEGPVVTLLVAHPEGRDLADPAPYLRELGIGVAGAALLACVLLRLAGRMPRFRQRMALGASFAVLVALAGPLASANRLGVPAGPAVLAAADRCAGWLLAAAVLAMWIRPRGGGGPAAG